MQEAKANATDAAASKAVAKVADDEIVEATVAAGRTVVTEDGMAKAGEEILLPMKEVRKLRKLGYLVDPDAEPIAESNGPTFGRG